VRIVVTVHALTLHGGAVTYAITVADHLQRLGHEVWLTTPLMGEAAAPARELGVRVVEPAGLPEDPDVVLSQDAGAAYELAERYPAVPQVYVAHSDIFDFQLPPALPGVVGAVVTMYDRVDDRVRALAAPHRVIRLTQPVDVERFKPLRPLPERPRVAVTLGNYVAGPRAELLREACARAGIELRHVGLHGTEQTLRPEVVLNQADVVFGKARVIAEAMACGRAAYVLDHHGGEGWVTAANRAALAADNFGGQHEPIEISVDRLAADLRDGYDPSCGLANRDHVVAHHAATKHAAALVAVLRDVAADPPPRPAGAPLDELARMVRLYQRADGHAFAMQVEAHRAAEALTGAETRVAQAEARAAAAEARAAEEQARADAAEARAEAAGTWARGADERAEQARAWAQDAQARVLDAEARAVASLRAVTGTRRWRVAGRLLAPADRLRRLLRRLRPMREDAPG
jgi:hypothetical protein